MRLHNNQMVTGRLTTSPSIKIIIMERNLEEIKRCKAITDIILAQVKGSCSSMFVFYSWGVSKLLYSFYNDMPTLQMKVSGAIHKGWVLVSLNEGKDLYEIRLLNNRKELKKEVIDIYADQLGSIIDSLVERPEGCSDEYYQKLIDIDNKKKHLV